MTQVASIVGKLLALKSDLISARMSAESELVSEANKCFQKHSLRKSGSKSLRHAEDVAGAKMSLTNLIRKCDADIFASGAITVERDADGKVTGATVEGQSYSRWTPPESKSSKVEVSDANLTDEQLLANLARVREQNDTATALEYADEVERTAKRESALVELLTARKVEVPKR